MAARETAERRAILVVSHERSGTHFLMNTLAANFGFVAQPWTDLDFPAAVNFYNPGALRRFLLRELAERPERVMKSHHVFGFFRRTRFLPRSGLVCFYIYRDPRDVLLSFRRYVASTPREGGPQREDPGDFCRAAPRGSMLRYQMRQEPTLLHRWVTHVTGWMRHGSQAFPGAFFPVRYEELNLDFENTLRRMAAFMGRDVATPVRPLPGENVVLAGPGRVGAYRDELGPEVLVWIRRKAGRTMASLGIPWDSPRS